MVERRDAYGAGLLPLDSEGLRECAVAREDEVEGLGVMLESAIDSLDLGIALISDFVAIGAEWSEVGGEGGVGVSETVEAVDLVGGVAIVGEEVDVAGER